MARMGALEDLLIISAVGIALIFKGAEWTRYLDVAATSILMISIIKSIFDVFSRSIGELLDKSIDEYNQLIILRQMAANFDSYDQLHGIRSRRSGSQTFIEIFLEFNDEYKMSEFYTLKEKIETELKSQIPGSQVLIVPSKV